MPMDNIGKPSMPSNETVIIKFRSTTNLRIMLHDGSQPGHNHSRTSLGKFLVGTDNFIGHISLSISKG